MRTSKKRVLASLVAVVTGAFVIGLLVPAVFPAPVEQPAVAKCSLDTPEAAVPAETSPELEQRDTAMFADLGVVVLDRDEGELALAHLPDAEFTSASLVKLLVAIEALQGGEPAARVHAMLARSDDEMASALWVSYGGPEIVTRWASRIGLEATRPPADPGRWGDTVMTARDVARIYSYLLDEAPGRVREVVLGALRASTPNGADGFDQTFGIPDAAGGLSWAAKQGWSCCIGGRILHSTGLLGADDRFVVVVLSASPVELPWPEVRAHVTALTSRVVETVTTGL